MRRWFVLVAIVVAAIVASKLVLENVLGIDLQSLAAARMADAGAGSALTVVLLLGIDVFLPVPSSIVMVLSGAAFGVVWGSVLSLVGSLAGEWLGFELARRYGRAASRLIVDEDELRKLERQFDRYGAAAVAITRALPIVMETMSIVAGLSTMKRSTFLLASILGTLPVVVIYAYAGAVSRHVGSIVPAVVILIAVAGAAWIWHRSRRDRLVLPGVSRTGAKG